MQMQKRLNDQTAKGKGKYANTKTPKRLNGKKTSDKNYNLSSQLSNPKGVECE